MNDTPPKHERLAEFLRRLSQAPCANSFEEASQQLCNILNEVENERTSIPYNPDAWQSDSRL